MEGESGARSRAGLRRREFLIGGAGAGIALAGPLNYAAMARSASFPVAKAGKFAHGVSSGFPTAKAITLWTRVSELDRISRLTLEVAKDKGFRKVVNGPRWSPQATATTPSTRASPASSPARSTTTASRPSDKHSQVGTLPHPAARRLQAAAADRLLLLPGLRGRLLQRPGGDRQGAGPRPGHLPRRLHLRAPLLPRPRRPGRHDRHQRRRRRPDARRVPRRSTTSTRPTRTCRRCTPPTRSCRSGTTTRSRTTTPATRPDSAQPNPHLENNKATRAACRSASAARTATRRSSRRCRGSSRRANEEPDLRLDPARRAGRAVPHRPAPVPRPAALRRRACSSLARRRGDPAGRSSAPTRRSGSRRRVPSSDAKWKLWASEVMVMSLDLRPGPARRSWTSGTATRPSASEILEHV